ncbi:SDR family oxidoreductase [Halostagnicola kamekurae]|uniref:Short-chain dehydrogenase n=1 Tax=Halostagnicola kamekurae TaxID=619731 RepID=A0A1I6RYT9_9EURY|nr:SDR family oxidoreductase [Halostagnicola kamekurae]SFS69844.1 Short-chain dehydrogenase [Halostagnicola kamekurae]
MNSAKTPLEEQVIVITGASSGIGLTTARMAADRGARVVLAARSEDALEALCEEIIEDGGDAEYVVADVSDRDDVREIARVAEDVYGGFHTWINGAAVPIYGRLEDIPVEEMHEQFETNLWGVVYGSLEAVDRLKDRDGTIINIGSVVSDRSLLFQGSYSASKHAVKAFTDALRMELEDAGTPISVTLVKPGSIDTPYPEHAKNYMDDAATLPPPVYAPEVPARAILHAAEHPQRDVTVGAGGKQLSVLGQYAPKLMDALMKAVFADQQRADQRPLPREHNTLEESSGSLADSADGLEQRGRYDGYVADSSLYTRIRQREKNRTSILGAALLAGIAAYAGYKKLRKGSHRSSD